MVVEDNTKISAKFLLYKIKNGTEPKALRRIARQTRQTACLTIVTQLWQ
jgi:hypothetical protein